MQNLRFNEIQNNNNNNTRSNFTQNTNLDSSNSSNRVDPAQLDRNQNSIFGLINHQNESISHKLFQNGSGSLRDPVQNGETDLTYYDWPAIDNFEDVDQLFRNSDSTFGQQSQMMEVEEEEEEETEKEQLSWFNNASDAIYTSEMEVLNNNLSAYPSSSERNPNPDSSDTSAINDSHKWRQQEEESVEEIMQELIDQKCSLVGPSEMNFSPFEQKQSLQLESDPSSYVTFNSYSGLESMNVPPVETSRQKPSNVTGNAPLSQGLKRKSEFERGSDEQKGMMDSSEEETSFRQLHNVMNQLDEKTKICIRDSLYRLARSVQQRTNCYNGDSQFCPKFVELNNESETNQVDRTIAELLFHQPLNTVNGNNEESMSLKSSISVSYFVNT